MGVGRDLHVDRRPARLVRLSRSPGLIQAHVIRRCVSILTARFTTRTSTFRASATLRSATTFGAATACCRATPAGGQRTVCRGIDKIIGPLIGHHYSRSDYEEQRHPRPDADHVVPVEVACLTRQAAAEQHNRAEMLPGHPARKPHVNAAQY